MKEAPFRRRLVVDHQVEPQPRPKEEIGNLLPLGVSVSPIAGVWKTSGECTAHVVVISPAGETSPRREAFSPAGGAGKYLLHISTPHIMLFFGYPSLVTGSSLCTQVQARERAQDPQTESPLFSRELWDLCQR